MTNNTLKTTIIINGANGKMGQIAQEAIKSYNDFKIVALCGKKDNLKNEILKLKPDIVLDLTLASVVYQNTKTIIECGSYPVIGTSGLTQKEVKKLSKLCEEQNIGGIIVPNFSLTAVLMMKFASNAAKYLKNVEIVEYHHDKKEESPSGTALRTAELISQHTINIRDRGTESIKGTLGGEYQNIPIHSIRLPGFIAQQEVIYGNNGELLSIKSDTTSREAFKKGILIACHKVKNKKKLYYGLEHFLD